MPRPRQEEHVALTFAAYQRRLVDLERERGWDRILPSHTFLHMAEELGEIGRVIQCLEGYRESEATPEELRDELAGELADLAAFVFKLASQQGIDVGAAMEDQLRKFTSRYDDVELGRREMARYVAYQERSLEWIKGGKGEQT
jgi:NTP pyrophosphatase (non-canonical NTP hydrolase)